MAPRGLYIVLTNTPDSHPWARYYAARGVARPPLAELAPTAAKSAGGEAPVAPAARPGPASALSPELIAALNAAAARPGPRSTASPFITAMQRQAAAEDLSRARWRRWLQVTGATMVALAALHFTVTRVICRAPGDAAVQAHAARLAPEVFALYTSARQPLQSGQVVVGEPERLSGDRLRFIAQVTLRLEQPLYVPALTNGTAAYRQLCTTVQAAREQELRFNLAPAAEAPELPLLIRAAHRAGDSMVVKVPFVARRYGWGWKFEPPQLALRTASRTFEGESIAFYADLPHLIYGAPEALAEVRTRMARARNYVMAVAKAVQRQAEREAVDALPADLAHAEAVPAIALVEATPDPRLANRPAIDPHAPAVAAADTPPAPAGPRLSAAAPRGRE